MDSFLQEAKAYARELGQRNLRIIKKNGNKFFIGRLVISDGVQRLGYSNNSKIL